MPHRPPQHLPVMNGAVAAAWDPNPGLTYSTALDIGLTITFVVLFAANLLLGRFVVHQAVATAVALVQGLLLAMAAPVTDVLVGFQYGLADSSPIMSNAFGHRIPLWAFIGWSGWLVSIATAVFAAAPRITAPRHVVQLYLALLGAEFAFEAGTGPRVLGMFTYTGHQPLALLGIPFIWPFVSVLWGMTIAFGLVAVRDHVARPAGFLSAVLLIPGSVLGLITFTGWPVMLGRGMQLSLPSMTLLGLGSLVLVALALFLLAHWCTRAPLPSAFLPPRSTPCPGAPSPRTKRPSTPETSGQ